MRSFEKEQIEFCQKYGVEHQPLNLNLKIGISDNLFSDVLPLNGLRHPEENNTCGWYLWRGEEMSNDEDFFKPMHLYHLAERNSELIKYLSLPAGWRFLLARDYEDVWFDASLLIA
jgi:hypothetical protein